MLWWTGPRSAATAPDAGFSGWTGRHFTYDGLGRAVEADATSLDSHAPGSTLEARTDQVWGSLGELMEEEEKVFRDGSLIDSRRVVSAYDEAGAEIHLQEISSGYDIHTERDALGRIARVLDGMDGELASESYLGPGSRLGRKTFSFNGTQTRLDEAGWDAQRRAVAIRHGTVQPDQSLAPFWQAEHGYSPASYLLWTRHPVTAPANPSP